MSTANHQLFMIRCEFDRGRLFDAAKHLGLPIRVVDEGYLLHRIMRSLFAGGAPQPFAIRNPSGRSIPVLGYSALDDRELRARLDRAADPLARSACYGDRLSAKLMPAAYPAGCRLSFETRVCPVARLGRDGPHNRKGAEVDVFLRECSRQNGGPPVLRQDTYRGWLQSQFERDGAAQLLEARLTGFRLQRLARRRHRSGDLSFARCQRPDATLSGLLEVSDPVAFAALVRRGLGRHRAFGFGMLLLKPVGSHHV